MSNAHRELHAAYSDLFIDGQNVRAGLGVGEIISPINGKVIGAAPVAGIPDAELALSAAHRSFENGAWSREGRLERSKRICRLLDAVMSRRDEIVRLMMHEMGYTRNDCESQLVVATDQVEKVAELAGRDPVRTLPLISTASPDGSTKMGGALIARDPIGVVTAITPYNAGFMLGLTKCAAALGAGNSVVLKPAPITPLQTMLLTELIAELDLPRGAFNMVTGEADVGAVLCSDPRVSMISFTGSDSVGAKILAQAAPHIIKCQLELGGKSALIVRHDADLASAVPLAMFLNFGLAGQGCVCTTRVLVDNRLRPDFVSALKQAAGYWKVGDPFAPGTVMGPLIREVARARVERFVRRAQEDGATLVAGGKRPEALDAELAGGFYFEPTIFDNVTNESYVARNEVFGPVMSVIGYDTDEQAVRTANDSSYGLGGAIVSRDGGQALNMALQIRAGMILVNGGSGRMHPDMPFGGYKRSGLGREWGEEGYNEYTQMKSISFPVC